MSMVLENKERENIQFNISNCLWVRCIKQLLISSKVQARAGARVDGLVSLNKYISKKKSFNGYVRNLKAFQ
jgi:hypothetical protein